MTPRREQGVDVIRKLHRLTVASSSARSHPRAPALSRALADLMSAKADGPQPACAGEVTRTRRTRRGQPGRACCRARGSARSFWPRPSRRCKSSLFAAIRVRNARASAKHQPSTGSCVLTHAPCRLRTCRKPAIKPTAGLSRYVDAHRAPTKAGGRFRRRIK